MRYELTKQKYLNSKELSHLQYVLERFKDRDPRNVNLLWVAMHTGGRPSEIINIMREDFCPIEGSVFIRSLKGGRDREIPLPKWLVKRVQAIEPHDDGRLFPILYQTFYKIWNMYRPCSKNLHSLRHTFALSLYRKTNDLRLVKAALGHNSITTTMIYLDYTYTMREMRRAILG